MSEFTAQRVVVVSQSAPTSPVDVNILGQPIIVTLSPNPTSVTGSVAITGPISLLPTIDVGPVGDLSGGSIFMPSTPGVTASPFGGWSNINSTWNQVSAANTSQHTYQAGNGTAYPYFAFVASRFTTGPDLDLVEAPFVWRFNAWSQGSGNASVDLNLATERLIKLSTTAAADVWWSSGQAGETPDLMFSVGSASIRAWMFFLPPAESSGGVLQIVAPGTGYDGTTVAATVFEYYVERFSIDLSNTNRYMLETQTSNPVTYPVLLATASNALANRSATIANAKLGYSQQYPATYNINT